MYVAGLTLAMLTSWFFSGLFSSSNMALCALRFVLPKRRVKCRCCNCKNQTFNFEYAAEDCFELGRQAYNAQDYYHTILWMEQAMEQLKVEPAKTVDAVTVLDYLAFSWSMVRTK